MHHSRELTPCDERCYPGDCAAEHSGVWQTGLRPALHLRMTEFLPLNLRQVVEAGAGAPWLLGASLPPGMTGPQVPLLPSSPHQALHVAAQAMSCALQCKSTVGSANLACAVHKQTVDYV